MSVPGEAEGGWRLAVVGIMPLYNKRATVLEAIASALAQTRTLEELVIVDDGSTDGSGDLVAERFAGDLRIRLMRQANAGVSAARNAAIRASAAPLVAFLDADDRWMPRHIEAQAGLMERRPDVMLTFSAAYCHNEATGETRVEGEQIDKAIYVRKTFFQEKLLPASDSVIVRRDALGAVGLFDESLWMGEDTDLWLRIMLRFDWEHVPEPLVWIRRGRPETFEGMERGFEGNERYFRKHRRTFGRGAGGALVWRPAYGAILRLNAIEYFRFHRGWKAMGKLVKAVWIWPFFNPSWVLKAALEYALGPRLYNGAVRIVRACVGCRKRPDASQAES